MPAKKKGPGLAALACCIALISRATTAQSTTSQSIVQTKNYIDTISGYHALSTCAEGVLSTIVRGEYSGCQDTYALTSYTCFCTDSSSFFNSVISRDVIASCNSSYASTQASSALGIFRAYCALGVEAGLTPQTSVPKETGSASPGSTASTSSPTETSSSSSTGSSGNTVAIAAGVAVPVGTILLALVGWLFWRNRKMSKQIKQLQWPGASILADGNGNMYGKGAQSPSQWGHSVEMATYEHTLVEMPGKKPPTMWSQPTTTSSPPQELPSTDQNWRDSST